MPNPSGNRLRCRSCGALASKDGWCKRHRPPSKVVNRERDNFMGPAQEFQSPNEVEDFGCLNDFGIVRRQ